jgi:hypothetical protein
MSKEKKERPKIPFTVTVVSSNGTLTAEYPSGAVRDVYHNVDGDIDAFARELKPISVFNFREWESYWKQPINPDQQFDILDLGYWYEFNKYEPPCWDWREEVKPGRRPPEDRLSRLSASVNEIMTYGFDHLSSEDMAVVRELGRKLRTCRKYEHKTLSPEDLTGMIDKAIEALPGERSTKLLEGLISLVTSHLGGALIRYEEDVDFPWTRITIKRTDDVPDDGGFYAFYDTDVSWNSSEG